MIKLAFYLFLTATMVAASLSYEDGEGAQERGEQGSWSRPASDAASCSEEKLEIFMVVSAGMRGCCGRWDVTNLTTEEGKPLWPSLYALGVEKVGADPFKTELLDGVIQSLIQEIKGGCEKIKTHENKVFSSLRELVSLNESSKILCQKGGWVWFINYESAYRGKRFVDGAVRLTLIPNLLKQGMVLLSPPHPLLREGFIIEGFPAQSDESGARPYWWQAQ